MQKTIQCLRSLMLAAGILLLAPAVVSGHDCGQQSLYELTVGQTDNYTIMANGISTVYRVSNNTSPSVASVTPQTLGNATDGVFSIMALAPGETMITIFWDATAGEGVTGNCTFTVRVTRPPSAFSLVQANCSSPGSPRTIYRNLSERNYGITVEATTTCQQTFTVKDRMTGMPFGTETVRAGARTFEMLAPSNTFIEMTCIGTGTCSYRLGGVLTTRDVHEKCDFGPEKVYENLSGKDLDVTIEGSTTCPTQSFTVVDGSGRETPDSGNVGEGTRLFSFRVRRGHSIVIFCTGAGGTGACNYIVAVPRSGTPQSGQVGCGGDQRIYRNSSGREMEVTVQVTASCNGATLTVSGDDGGEAVPAGETRTRTFTLAAGGTINLNCAGPLFGGSCTYTILEGT
ncbi:MAG: hypothetical protein HY650_01710 [Acidobacteria bacterium]|nr:hypothetical protein [Acidobacteriota bacterium]